MEGTSNIQEKTECEDLQRAYELESVGKKNLLSENYADAVADLSEACQIFSELFGDLSEKCASVQFAYGSALLGLAREESAVLANEGESSDEEEENPSKEEEEPSKLGKNGEAGKLDKQKVEKKSVEQVESEKTEDKEENPNETLDQDEEEDVSNLQVAWEVLDLARQTYERLYSNGEEDAGKKLANTLRALGEVAMESDNYPQAIEDFGKCLEIQVKVLPSDDRAISETHFNMGSAYSCNGEITNAISSYKTSISILEEKMSNLKKEASSSETEAAKKAAMEEIEDITRVISDIKERMEDTVEAKKEVMETIDLVKPAVEKKVYSAVFGGDMSEFGETTSGFDVPSIGSAESVATSSSVKSVNLITAVKRKAPKAEENDRSDEKKPKVEP
ncbi:protein HGV2-like isoform X2 [Artemia franciscana]|uniref:protein HGV2-like isoform X2 n=1 Tax=Artemia franciscana TaxID=6661 RepID=UPI0032DAF5C8